MLDHKERSYSGAHSRVATLIQPSFQRKVELPKKNPEKVEHHCSRQFFFRFVVKGPLNGQNFLTSPETTKQAYQYFFFVDRYTYTVTRGFVCQDTFFVVKVTYARLKFIFFFFAFLVFFIILFHRRKNNICALRLCEKLLSSLLCASGSLWA